MYAKKIKLFKNTRNKVFFSTDIRQILNGISNNRILNNGKTNNVSTLKEMTLLWIFLNSYIYVYIHRSVVIDLTPTLNTFYFGDYLEDFCIIHFNERFKV